MISAWRGFYPKQSFWSSGSALLISEAARGDSGRKDMAGCRSGFGKSVSHLIDDREEEETKNEEGFMGAMRRTTLQRPGFAAQHVLYTEPGNRI
jgi:hypothetical protein